MNYLLAIYYSKVRFMLRSDPYSGKFHANIIKPWSAPCLFQFHANFSSTPRSVPHHSQFHAKVSSTPKSVPRQGQFHTKVTSTLRSFSGKGHIHANVSNKPKSRPVTTCHGMVSLKVSSGPRSVSRQSQLLA